MNARVLAARFVGSRTGYGRMSSECAVTYSNYFFGNTDRFDAALVEAYFNIVICEGFRPEICLDMAIRVMRGIDEHL